MNSALENEPKDKIKPTTLEKYLTFRLGTESYGLSVLKVREIIRMQNITNVPQMPDYVKGVINLRGRVIPVLDLRLRFELEAAEATEATCIIVVQIRMANGDEKLIGLVVDSVEEVLNIAKNEIEEAPDFGNKLSVDYISGMAKYKSGVKTLLDIDRVINDSNLEQLNN
jgi:purine-binding chemotaxis protein CheW